MIRGLRQLDGLFVLAGLGCLAIAAWMYLWPSDEPGLIVAEPDRPMTGLVAGQVGELTFAVHNRSGTSRRVVGGPCFV